jgi:hypothetical protein
VNSTEERHPMTTEELQAALRLDPAYRTALEIEGTTYLTGMVSDVSCTDPVEAVIETGEQRRFADQLADEIQRMADPGAAVQLYHDETGHGRGAWYDITGVQVDRLNHLLVVVAGDCNATG